LANLFLISVFCLIWKAVMGDIILNAISYRLIISRN
jgi:hypothetical protein